MQVKKLRKQQLLIEYIAAANFILTHKNTYVNCYFAKKRNIMCYNS